MKKILSCLCAMIALGLSVGVGRGVLALTEMQTAGIVDHCESIKDNLKKVQKQDARTRVYLGGYYETILSDFVMPLNVRLVENSISDPGLIENQSKIAEAKIAFMDDYIKYQQGLEELVGMDCKKDVEKFYDKLVSVRKKRKVVEQDVTKMRDLVSEHVELVNGLKEKIK